MSEEFYYCTKCGHRHRYVSKIGMNHIQYEAKSSSAANEATSIPDEIDIPTESFLIQDTLDIPSEQEDKNEDPGKRIGLGGFIRGYRDSYRIGQEKFGIWWTIFQLSIWSIVLIFLLMAVIAFVVYLPKIELLLYNL